jgi:hypothetical protein
MKFLRIRFDMMFVFGLDWTCSVLWMEVISAVGIFRIEAPLGEGNPPLLHMFLSSGEADVGGISTGTAEQRIKGSRSGSMIHG